jgi:hypothetical protein
LTDKDKGCCAFNTCWSSYTNDILLRSYIRFHYELETSTTCAR